MSRYTNTVPQIFDKNKVAIVGAKKFFFEPGTTTLKTIYSDSDLTVPAANPQLSDADGRFTDDIFLDGIYKEVQQDNSGTVSGFDGVTLWTKDPVGGVDSGEFGLWVSGTIYNIPDKVIGSDDFSYESLTDNNQGNDPVSSPSNWARITFVKAGVLDGVSEAKDTNSLTSIILAAISNAVNYLKFSNAATGNGPIIEPDGTDTNIDLNINAKGTGTVNVDIVGNVTGNVTGAATVDVDTITADTANGDLELTRNGTGAITVDSTPIYGMVLLDTPVLLATDTSITATGNTPVDITAQTTGVAVKAILNVYLNGFGGASNGDSEVLTGEGGETLTTIVHRAVYFEGSSGYLSDCNQVTVNLATGEIFDYQILQTGTAPVSRDVRIYLAGYYV